MTTPYFDSAARVRGRVVEWLDDNFHFGLTEQVIGDDDRSFLENAVLDSLGFVQLVLFLEDEFDLEIDRQSLTPANFDSMRKIVTYVTGHPTFEHPR